ncbi:fimbrial protein [Mixta tenebrionis]|uniref:Type 1 fimbrial protein n=1 Tax=Mixta tenebrionis TaxID=2562439 RepID=A0A506VE28_9GAMM|nr:MULTISPECIES: fimbrial protein [Mixta]QHM76942.1 Fimbria adhesin protein [Mixta theicola]TPW43649.1 type 1 fimbrial protein [Mixta tenebrionis]
MKNLTVAGVIMMCAAAPACVQAAGCELGTPRTQQFTLPDLLVDPNQPPGSVIGSKTIAIAGDLAQNCTGSVNWQSVLTGSWASPSGVLPDVYETGIPGVGVKVSDALLPDSFMPVNTTLTPDSSRPLIGSDVQLLFYRTGDITPGSFPGGEVARFMLTDSSGNLATALTLQAASGSVRMKSCYAKSNNLVVQLGSVNRSSFTGVGSTVAPTAFAVELVCQGNLPVKVSFSSAGGAPSPEPGIVPIQDGAGAASGIAIKVMHRDGRPLHFDTPEAYHLAGEPEISIPLLASYTPTGIKVTPGTARGAMTFTITQD